MSNDVQEPAAAAAFHEARPCPEMLATFSEPEIEVFRVTADLAHDAHCPAMHSSFGLFTPDSRRFVIERQHGLGSGPDWKMELLLCDIEDGFSLRLLTDEARVRGPILSHDGRVLYYWDDQSGGDKPRLVLKQVDLETFRRETLLVVDSPVPGIGRPPRGGQMYDMSSLRRDGRRLAASCSFFTDDDPQYGTIIVDLAAMRVHGFQFEAYNWRPIGLYYRGDDPRYRDHLLICRTHRQQGVDNQGKWYDRPEPDYPGRVTLHIVTDEGRWVAAVPVGDTGEGVDHPTWRGGKYEIVTHTSSVRTAAHWRGILLCSEPIACAAEDRYKGAHIPGARRFELTRRIVRPDECHHAWDQSGTRVVADTEGWAGRGTAVPIGPSAHLWIGTVVEGGGEDPVVVPKFLLNPRSSWTGNYWTEIQPAMSPDCRTVFFNSDWLGQAGHPQVFAVRGFQFPEPADRRLAAAKSG
ncbi:MAG: hypothetical protein BWZ02_01902 [Lentisphaerae bacterium ADurb.BinA184]|nr:MAG: hypothetical protein BWZ02_01902 [Lentisphaerae bacterium ADurb.BinA184]